MLPISNHGLEPKLKLRSRIIAAVILALCVAAAYLPVLSAGWVYDDVNLVKPSPALINLSGLGRAISTDLYSQAAPRLEVSPYWRPLAMISFWLDTRLGEAPGVIHIGNILLNALAAALMGLVIIRRHGGIGGIIAAAVAALWWALHPENVEVVAWISCRYELLMAVALLGILLLPWRKGPLRAALYGIIFFAGLLSKEGFVVMAVAIAAMDFADRRPVLAAAPRWGAVFIAILIWVILRAAIGIRSMDLPPPDAILRMIGIYFETIAIYFWRALVPGPLTISHPFASGGALVILAGIAIFAALAAAAILFHIKNAQIEVFPAKNRKKGSPAGAAALKRRQDDSADNAVAAKRPQLLVPVVIFLAGLIPMAAAITMFHEMPERYFFVPSIGLALLVGELVAFAVASRYKLMRILVPSVAAVVIILGIIQLEKRLPDWRSDESLWTSALRVDPRDPNANYNIALAAGRSGDWVKANQTMLIAVQENPDSSRIAIGYAWVLLQSKNTLRAAVEAERATKLAPYEPDGWYYMAQSRHMLGNHAGELEALDKLLEIAPNYPGMRKAREIAACEASGRFDCY